jgi:hypothetical protein
VLTGAGIAMLPGTSWPKSWLRPAVSVIIVSRVRSVKTAAAGSPAFTVHRRSVRLPPVVALLVRAPTLPPLPTAVGHAPAAALPRGVRGHEPNSRTIPRSRAAHAPTKATGDPYL